MNTPPNTYNPFDYSDFDQDAETPIPPPAPGEPFLPPSRERFLVHTIPESRRTFTEWPPHLLNGNSGLINDPEDFSDLLGDDFAIAADEPPTDPGVERRPPPVYELAVVLEAAQMNLTGQFFYHAAELHAFFALLAQQINLAYRQGRMLGRDWLQDFGDLSQSPVLLSIPSSQLRRKLRRLLWNMNNLWARRQLSFCAVTEPDPVFFLQHCQNPSPKRLRVTLRDKDQGLREIFQQGYDFAEDGRYRVARTLFQWAAEKDPDNEGVHNNLAVCNLKLGYPEFALESADHAVQLDPHYGLAYHTRANCLAALGRLPEAIEAYETALVREPRTKNDPRLHGNRSLVYEKMGDHRRAFEACLAAFADPHDTHCIPLAERLIGDAWREEVSSKERLRLYDLMLAEAKSFAAKHPSPLVRFHLFQAFFRAGSPDALYFRELAEASDPPFSRIHPSEDFIAEQEMPYSHETYFASLASDEITRVAVFRSMPSAEAPSKADEPVSLIAKTAKETPDPLQLAHEAFVAGDSAAEIQHYEEALLEVAALTPDLTADIYNNMALAYESLGDKTKAISIFEQALAIRPGHELALKHLRRLKPLRSLFRRFISR